MSHMGFVIRGAPFEALLEHQKVAQESQGVLAARLSICALGRCLQNGPQVFQLATQLCRIRRPSQTGLTARQTAFSAKTRLYTHFQ